MRVFDLTSSTIFPESCHVLRNYRYRYDIKDLDFGRLEFEIYRFWKGVKFPKNGAWNKELISCYIDYVLGHVPVFFVTTKQIGQNYVIKENESSVLGVTVPDNKIKNPKITKEDFSHKIDWDSVLFGDEDLKGSIRKEIRDYIEKEISSIHGLPIKFPVRKVTEIILDRIFNDPARRFYNKYWDDEHFQLLLNLIEEDLYNLFKDNDVPYKSFIKTILKIIFNCFKQPKVQFEDILNTFWPYVFPDESKYALPNDLDPKPDENNKEKKILSADALYCSFGGMSANISHPEIFVYLDELEKEMEVRQSGRYLMFTIAHEFAHAMMDENLLNSFLFSNSKSSNRNFLFNDEKRQMDRQLVDSILNPTVLQYYSGVRHKKPNIGEKEYIIREESLATAAALHIMGNDPYLKLYVSEYPLEYRYALTPKFQKRTDVQKNIIPDWIKCKIDLSSYSSASVDATDKNIISTHRNTLSVGSDDGLTHCIVGGKDGPQKYSEYDKEGKIIGILNNILLGTGNELAYDTICKQLTANGVDRFIKELVSSVDPQEFAKQFIGNENDAVNDYNDAPRYKVKVEKPVQENSRSSSVKFYLVNINDESDIIEIKFDNIDCAIIYTWFLLHPHQEIYKGIILSHFMGTTKKGISDFKEIEEYICGKQRAKGSVAEKINQQNTTGNNTTKVGFEAFFTVNLNKIKKALDNACKKKNENSKWFYIAQEEDKIGRLKYSISITEGYISLPKDLQKKEIRYRIPKH